MVTQLELKMNKLLCKAFSKSTINTYRRGIAWLNSYMDEYFPSQPVFPLSHYKMALFITYMYEKALAPATICTYAASITTCHKLANFQDPSSSLLVKKLLIATKKAKSTKDCRLPITKNILNLFLKNLHIVTETGTEYITYRAMFLLAFYAFLRIGEITARALTDDTSKLTQVQDITVLVDRIGQAKSAQICIKHWKSQIPGIPFTITINAQVGNSCPVLALKNFITLRGSTPGPLFTKNKLPITRSQFNIVLNKVTKRSGLDTKRIKSHSFRIGAATTAAGLGFSEDQIKRMGRWRSDAVKSYIRITSFKI